MEHYQNQLFTGICCFSILLFFWCTSGYRVRVDNNSDSEHSGVLRVDYSESRDDEAEYLRKQEDEERRRREDARREEEKTRVLARHSDAEAQKLTDKLKGKKINLLIRPSDAQV